MATNIPVNMDTLITVKVQIQGSNRKFKLPLRDLVPAQFPQKLRSLLSIPGGQGLVLERFSDSAAAYVTLDPENIQVYKTLMRAAKAKLKLRIRATVTSDTNEEPAAPTPSREEASIPAPEAPKPRPVSLAAPFNQLSSHRPIHSMPARQSLYDLKSSTVEAIKPVQAQLPEKSAPVDGEEEAPVPKPFPARESKPVSKDSLIQQPSLTHLDFFAELQSITRERDLALRMKEPPSLSPLYSWSVYCNNCDKPMANEHYHCSICDDGDYDLCSACVDAGHHCPGERHWLIKRFVQNGKVINSTTEKIAPKPKADPEIIPSPKLNFEIEPEIPGAFTEEKKIVPEAEEPTRTCNACVKVFREREFVTCADCEDYDLCLQCHLDEKHGHHPGHTFRPATTDTSLNAIAETLCKAGRNVRHNAICDGCDKFIYGVRHKCLNCPDWDYCTKCIESAKFIHPVHRFVPIYDPLPEPRSKAVRHYGIYCDGPLCQDKDNQTYIEGVRYKCAVCHDTDFCAACEAIPINRHNRTHPLIKFKTPVRNVSVTTMGEDRNGVAMATMGDQFQKSVSTETLPVSSANAATQVQTIADLKPTEAEAARPAKQLNIKDLLSEPIKEKITVQDLLVDPLPQESKVEEQEASSSKAGSSRSISSTDLNAHFIRDTITDGTRMPSGSVFVQSWTVRNPGPHVWPAGCSVRYVGGDNMLNIDDSHPSSATEINEATETNTVSRQVEVGEEISFTVTLKAPKKEGTAISYWRLKAADGTPFGHRLWCHIEVTPPHPISDLSMKLMLLERLNKARLEAARQEQDNASREATSRAALAEAEKRHAKVRAETLENMRRAAALIDGDLQKLTSDAANLSLGATAKDEIEPKVETPSEPSPAKAKAPAQPTVESAPPSPAATSAMIFPKLEKESPVSSTHESHRAEASSSKANTEVLMSPSVKSVDHDIFEDAESVEFFDESDSDEDGFVTDEEYDILDASDEEAA